MLERRRRAGGRELAGRVLGRAPAGVEQQHRQAHPGEGAHRALPPGRPGVGDEGDHRHRAALDAERHAEPDRPQEGEARQLLGAEERVAEGVAGEDVARQRQHRQRDRRHRAHARDPHRRLRVDLGPARRRRQRPRDPPLGGRDGRRSRIRDRAHAAYPTRPPRRTSARPPARGAGPRRSRLGRDPRRPLVLRLTPEAACTPRSWWWAAAAGRPAGRAPPSPPRSA